MKYTPSDGVALISSIFLYLLSSDSAIELIYPSESQAMMTMDGALAPKPEPYLRRPGTQRRQMPTPLMARATNQSLHQTIIQQVI
jgi:hypothetical protein